jgi:hypothetical protein
MSVTSCAYTVLTEFAVASRRLIEPPAPPLTVHGSAPMPCGMLIVLGAG